MKWRVQCLQICRPTNCEPSYSYNLLKVINYFECRVTVLPKTLIVQFSTVHLHTTPYNAVQYTAIIILNALTQGWHGECGRE